MMDLTAQVVDQELDDEVVYTVCKTLRVIVTHIVIDYKHEHSKE